MKISNLILICLLQISSICSFAQNAEWLDQLTHEGAIKTCGNRMVLFKTGQEKFNDMFKAIEQAQSSIHMEYFNFRDDSLANLLFDKLEGKVKQGVEVRLLFDSFGNDSNNKPIRKDKLKELQNRGLNIQVFRPARFPWLNYAFDRDHRKIVVIDGKCAYSGGMNVADYYIIGKPEFGEWRDMHFRIEGDAVAEYQKIFMHIWKKTTGEEISGSQYYPGLSLKGNTFKDLKTDTTYTESNKTIYIINREPHITPAINRKTFAALINNAKDSIKLINPYFTLRHSVRKAFKKAIKRGIQLEIMVSEKCDIPITPRIVDYNVRKLQKLGAKVYYFQGGFHHSKIMMVDGKYSFLGSTNLDSRSLYWDYEVNALVDDKPTTHELESIFEHDKKNRCVPLTDEYWKNKKGKFWDWFYHFLQPWV